MDRRRTAGNRPLSAQGPHLREEVIIAIGVAIASALTAGVAASGWWAWQARQGELLKLQAVLCLLCAGNLAMVLLHRRLRKRFGSMRAIRRALLAADRGEVGSASLSVSSDLGPEGAAWNKLLEEIEQLRNRVVAERATQMLGLAHSADRELRGALDVLPHGMILVDDKMCIKYANGAAAVLLAAKRDEMPGADLAGFIPYPDVLNSIKAIVDGRVARRSAVEAERRRGGNFQALRFNVRLMRRGDEASAMIAIEDITQQRIAAESRDAFVAQATHELRAPLTNIRMYVETAMEASRDDAVTRGKCLNVINQETRRLERIVGEILSISQMEAGSFTLQLDDVRLRPVLEELKSNYEAQARDKRIAMDFDLAPDLGVIRGDRDKIVLALQNLLSNAIKYTPAPGNVRVAAEVKKDQLVVEVSDTGIGVSEEDVRRIFEKFYRAGDQRVEKIPGSGLGLAIAREVIRLHGGDITVESEQGKGSRFTLTLPVAAEAA